MGKLGGSKGKPTSKRTASPRRGGGAPKSPPAKALSAGERLALLGRRIHPGKSAGQTPEPAVEPDLPPPADTDSAPAPQPESPSPGTPSANPFGERILASARRGLAGLGRIAALPWTLAARAFTEAFAPVAAEGDRRGSAAFHQPRNDAPPVPAGPSIPADVARAFIAQALAGLPDKGDSALPDDLASLALLLSDPPPSDDFKASDLVRDCFAPWGASGLPSRALLGVALRLTAEFGRPSRLPLAADRAWRMLDPVTFEDEFAEQLRDIGTFISDWQKTRQNFLVLEFGEIDMIEWLFESLHPGRHSDLLFEVMNFKVLSNRRQGILRRIPHRVRKFVKDCGGGHEAVLYAAGARAYLNRLVTTHGFTPIVETAAACLEEVEKVLEKLAPPALPGAASGDPQALARINPVKMPASELADQAMAAARAAAPPPPPPPAAARPAPAPAFVPPPPAAPSPVAAPQALAAAPSPVLAPPPPPASSASGSGAPPVFRPTETPAAAAPAPAPAAPLPATVRPAIIRLQQQHLQPGTELTIPSRSAARFPLGRMFSIDRPEDRTVAAISVVNPQTRPAARPKQLPGRVDVVIPPALPLAGPAALPPAAAPAATAPAPAQPRSVTGRIGLSLPGKTAAVPPPTAAPASAPAPAAAKAPAPADAVPPVLADNVAKLTVVPKRRLPITQALKRQTVMRVLRGEDVEQVAQSIGISRTKLDDWVDKFVAAGAGALSAGRRKTEELTVDTLRAKLAEVLATAQLIEQVMESSLPRRPILLPPPAAALPAPTQPAADAAAPRRRTRKKQG